MLTLVKIIVVSHWLRKSYSTKLEEGNKSIIGLMIESHINEGNQSSDLALEDMQYGVSITDACINWAATEALLRHAHKELVPFLEDRLK